jgi:HK97 family phage prohead protease
MYGRFASFGEWAEIRSAKEGHFFESVAPTAFERTIAENRQHVRCLFHHGQDLMCGVKPLGPIRTLELDTSYEVELLDVDYVRAVIPGIEAGQYGVSFGFHVVKDEVTVHPSRSDWNPKGIPQVTIREARLREFGPTPFPAYKHTRVAVPSESVREFAHEFRGDSYMLGPRERLVTRAKPGSPGTIDVSAFSKVSGPPGKWTRRSPGGG